MSEPIDLLIAEIQQCKQWHADDQILFDEARDAVLKRDWAALDKLFTVTVDPKNGSDLCLCGHRREQHIYNEGPCRPGYVCPHFCTDFARKAP